MTYPSEILGIINGIGIRVKEGKGKNGNLDDTGETTNDGWIGRQMRANHGNDKSDKEGERCNMLGDN